jgi:hypothetical protein
MSLLTAIALSRSCPYSGLLMKLLFLGVASPVSAENPNATPTIFEALALRIQRFFPALQTWKIQQ